MRVLFALRVNAFSHPGGDTVQAVKTSEALRNFGLSVDITTNLAAPLKDYDVVHLFNLLRVHETYWFARRALRHGVPMVLSPIYWDLRLEPKWQPRWLALLVRVLGRSRAEWLKTVGRVMLRKELNRAALLQLACGYRRQQQRVIEWSSCLLPNSCAERELISKAFGRDDKPVVVVPNAADAMFADGDAKRFEEVYGLRDFVLCVGRFEPRKNQLRVLEAAGVLGLPLVFVGQPNANHMSYYRRLIAMARRRGSRVRILPPMRPEELADAYAAARVHVQASWWETTGLASLEAALAGCNVVVTTQGPTREYFGQYAWYCDPWDVESIRKAVAEAWAARKRPELREHILRNYTWERAAQVTLEAYKMVVG